MVAQTSVDSPCSNTSGLWLVDPCRRTRNSIQLGVLTRLDHGLCRCANISLQPFDRTCLDYGSCCLQASFPPCFSNTFGRWILVDVHASVSCTVFHARWVIDSVSGYKHLPLPPWSDTFGFWSPSVSPTRLDHGSLSAYASVFNPVFLRVWIVIPFVRTHPSQPCSNTFD